MTHGASHKDLCIINVPTLAVVNIISYKTAAAARTKDGRPPGCSATSGSSVLERLGDLSEIKILNHASTF